MKKQLGFVGMLVIVLALGVLFTGCENGVQEVEGNVGIVYEKANAVSAVSAALTTNNIPGPSENYFSFQKYVIVKWDAVDNVQSYDVYVQQEGKKSINDFNGRGQNGDKYAATDGDSSSNDDVDKWSAEAIVFYVSSSYNSSTGKYVADTPEYSSPFASGKKYRFGVKTSPLSSGGNITSSDIVWSEYVQF